MKDFYFKKVLIKDCLLQLQKDIVDMVKFVRTTGNQSQNEIITETSDKISSLIEEEIKNVNDLFDDFFEELEMDKQRRQQRRQKRRVLEKVFAT